MAPLIAGAHPSATYVKLEGIDRWLRGASDQATSLEQGPGGGAYAMRWWSGWWRSWRRCQLRAPTPRARIDKMSPTVRELYEKASELPAGERAELAGLLLETLEDRGAEDAIEEVWAKEIERRMADYRAGRVKTISWQEVRAQLHRPNR